VGQTLRVLYDGEVFTSPTSGGVARYFMELIDGLGVHDIDTQVVAPLHSSAHLQSRKGRGAGAYIPSFRGSVRLLGWAHHRMAPSIARHRSFDVWHSSWYGTPLPETGKPVVVTIHDMIHEIFTPLSDECRIKRRAVERADRVICVSENTRKDLINLLRINPEKVSVVHHGHNDFGLPVSNSSVRLPIERPYILFVGRRGGYKNFERLIEAFSCDENLKRDYGILCFGGGPFSKDEIDSIRKLGLSQKHVAQMSGPDKLLAIAYQSAMALVYPSLYEGFGLPPLEAMSASCPVICSSAACLPEIVGDAALLFDPNDSDSLIHALERIRLEGIRRDLINRGHERRRKFAWSQSFAEHAKLYYETLKSAHTKHFVTMK